MRKLVLALLLAVVFVPATLYAGGIVTNTNQSASFIRMPALDAIIGVEGTYFNPAGLTNLSDGFYLSLSNQTVSQTRNIKSTFDMNLQEFEGKVAAPLFPTFYAVYKKDKFAYSLGVNPIGGGGSAGFENGLPSFEQQVAVLPTLLTASGIPTTQYSVKSNFDGSSLNWGVQFNATYSLTEMLSFSIGFRYIYAKNTYTGYLKDMMINPNQPAFGDEYNGSSLVSAPQFFTDASNTFSQWAFGANTYYVGLQGIVDAGLGTTLLINGATAGLTAEQIAQIQGLLGAAGLPPAAIGAIDIQTAQATLGIAAPVFTQNSVIMAGYAANTSNKEVDAAQTGHGIAPIIGVNMKFSDKFNLAVKYEHKADITLTNETVIDGTGMFTDGAQTPSDMPSLLTVGVGVRPIEKLNINAGFHMYFDKNANYGKQLNGEFVENSEVMDGNSIEAAFGLEYMVTDKILVSAGYLMTKTGANDKYHSDLSHSLNTSSIGLGGKYMVNENIGINLGFMKTMYQGYTKSFTGYQEEYNRDAMVIAVGIDYKF
ncbi:MAG TPA: aromatic hydrocarbon degradation protein [Tenuifilaceae bacterium]|nr:aromatic hydrocarbon degradation protein [Tenuifilaceae bacterium]HPJ45960.1 aromatic hydrocarbon degradation protein [Tenuifilaceae bacterium]HPQ34304.1 aromatic hydrocarbon degradation protein [Tenuifilaceae bacterium]HRX67972.1 aromatic hydrocarbon degradation protein [Tenuifilaceae bacterium]